MFLASPITFPNLGITVDPSPVAFTVFGKDIFCWPFCICCTAQRTSASRRMTCST